MKVSKCISQGCALTTGGNGHYEPVDCATCRGTGFKGRTGVFECVKFDVELSQVIATNVVEAELCRLIRSKGVNSLNAEALSKVSQGITSLDEAISVRWL